MTLQRSPLDAEHRALGATMVEFGGWEMPIAYPSGTIEEHLACRNRAVMFDVSHLGTVRVEGPDAYERLQTTLTNDLDASADNLPPDVDNQVSVTVTEPQLRVTKTAATAPATMMDHAPS